MGRSLAIEGQGIACEVLPDGLCEHAVRSAILEGGEAEVRRHGMGFERSGEALDPLPRRYDPEDAIHGVVQVTPIAFPRSLLEDGRVPRELAFGLGDALSRP